MGYAELLGLDPELSDEEIMEALQKCQEEGKDFIEMKNKKGKKVKLDPKELARFTQDYWDTSLRGH
ncbi:MAG: hypothetical protein QW331_03645 [Candidatus Woesearchaeota archaeon]